MRVLAEVPSRLAIMGTSAVLVPELFGQDAGRRLVVRQPALIAALTLLFEALWERAMAVPGLDGTARADDRTSDRRLLLDQLAAGAKDEQIARTLGLSLRTVRRRVADLLDELGRRLPVPGRRRGGTARLALVVSAGSGHGERTPGSTCQVRWRSGP